MASTSERRGVIDDHDARLWTAIRKMIAEELEVRERGVTVDQGAHEQADGNTSMSPPSAAVEWYSSI